MEDAKLQLPIEIRENLVEELDEMLEAYSHDPDAEAIVSYLLEQLEILADEEGVEDVVTELEENAALDAPLAEVLESEMSSNDEFEFTGEEVVSLLERLCEIEWEDEDNWEEDEDEDEDEDEVDEDDEY